MLAYQILGFVCVAFVAHARSPSKVISGYDVDGAHFPFLAKIGHIVGNDGKIVCSGTIVSTRYILTTAHCLESTATQNLVITVGSNSEYERTYRVEKQITHGGSDNGGPHDIGLLRTTEDIVYQEGHIGPVELTSKDYRDDGYPVELVGYGITSMSDDFPSELQWLATRIYDQDKCKSETTTVKDDRWICTVEELGQGFCFGDSGGPLIADGVQIGIIARGEQCGLGIPSIYVRIYHYLDWIHEQIRQ